MGIELGTHPLDLHVGLVPYIFKKLLLPSLKDYRKRKALAADVGTAGVVGVIDPQSCSLVLAVKGDEFYVEHRAKVPRLAAGTPFRVPLKTIEIVNTHHLNPFRSSHVKGLVHISESTERIRSVHVGVDVD